MKPDLLLHRPGDMGGNLVVIEVKPATASPARIGSDLGKLTAFRREGRYYAAFYLFYGTDTLQLDSVRQHCLAAAHLDDVDLSLIELYFHAAAGQAAEPQTLA